MKPRDRNQLAVHCLTVAVEVRNFARVRFAGHVVGVRATWAAACLHTRSSQESPHVLGHESLSCQVHTLQVALALKNVLFGVGLDAYWLPQSEHMFLWPCSYSDQTFGR